MSKITIEIKDNSKTIVTYDNDSIIIPICDCDENNYHISEVTDITCLELISDAIYQCALTLKYQLVKQGFINKPLNKPADRK